MVEQIAACTHTEDDGRFVTMAIGTGARNPERGSGLYIIKRSDEVLIKLTEADDCLIMPMSQTYQDVSKRGCFFRLPLLG